MSKRKNNKYQNWSKKELIREIERFKKRKKYGIVWEEKREKVAEICKEKLPVLKEIKNKEITTDKNKPVNLLIEGDNYHSLSVLNYTHGKKIDVIYIDPPYNTGNKEFVFNDRIIDLEDSYRHSKWLSFMSKRLRLAKNLLKDTGVIFISIDDNEYSQLKLLLDEIFTPKNFVASVTLETNPRGRQQMDVAVTHEYLLIYARRIENVSFAKAELTDEQIKEYSRVDKRGRNYREIGFRKRGAAARRSDVPNLFYPVYVNPKTGAVSLNKNKGYTEKAIPVLSNGREGRWRWGREKFKRNKGKLYGRIVSGKRWDIFEKDYLVKDGRRKGTKFKSIWDEKELNYEKAKKELKEIFGGESPFEYPKTVYLIKKILKMYKLKNAIVLDFMAGSGTTGQGVLELNKEDGGNRQFILCTNNENNICTDVCYPRIKKVIKGYEYEGKEKEVLFKKKIILNTLRYGNIQNIYQEYQKIREENKKQYEKLQGTFKNNIIRLYGIKNIKGKKEGFGGNLKYFKTDFVDAEPTDRNKIKLTQQATEMLCIKERTFEKVSDKKDFKIFKNSNHYTGIIFDQLAIPEFKKAIRDIKGKFSVYVFSLSDETFEEEFTNVKQNIKLFPIPEAILRVYRRIFR
jgi:adenine-specific DNA-methyltransferase